MKRLFFLQDVSEGFSPRQVYSGHSGTGRNFKFYMSDYGKYAMRPTTRAKCKELIEKIEKDAKGKFKFKWNIVPITDIELTNFYEDTAWNYEAYEKIRQEQINKFGYSKNYIKRDIR
jgi:hypothetical protein